MKRIGITGTIASGKSSVSTLLKRRGMLVFNADNYAKRALIQGNPCYDTLVELLGKDVLDASGDIDSKKMAEIIFHHEELREKVNGIVHPYVREGMLKFFASHEDLPMVFAEVALLFEAHWENDFDEIVVVTCSKDEAIRRMMDDRDYTQEQAHARYDSQIDMEQQILQADFVIHNDGTLQELDSQVNKWIGTLRRAMRHGNENN